MNQSTFYFKTKTLYTSNKQQQGICTIIMVLVHQEG